MNTITVLDSQQVAKIQTCQCWVLEDNIKDLLLMLSAIDAVILKGQSNQTLIVNDAMEKCL